VSIIFQHTMEEFFVPDEPEQLWSNDSEIAFKVQHLVDYENTVPALGEAAESERTALLHR
jgi:hypothetical protein